MKKKLVVFSGAGISPESGVKSLDSNGLWENHRIEDVASFEGFQKNPQMVLDFYNARRKTTFGSKTKCCTLNISGTGSVFDVEIITQNVDDFHEGAGSSKVIHLHGELLKVRPLNSETEIFHWEKELNVGDCDANGVQLRPHIVSVW